MCKSPNNRKIAPQNIMYDRRVVRGNTHAALVVPTSMQPDPAIVEREKDDRLKKKAQYEQMRAMRQDDDERRHLDDQEMELQSQQLEEEQHNKDAWDNLSNEDEAVNESQLEPDFVVDRPPTPEFIPNEQGVDKETQVIDTELFDFELEVEPILQVLVGKSTENARVEVIEEWEQDNLSTHKKKFLQIKEAELMETQRMEAARNRRRREMERRALQHKTAKDQRYRGSLKMTARSMAKKFLAPLRNDTFTELQQQGILRDPRQYSLIAHFLPTLQSMAEESISRQTEIVEDVDGFLMTTLRGNSRAH